MSEKKYVFITGASSGIGYYCATKLQQNGYHVIASCRKLRDASRLQAQGITCLQLDLDDSESITQAVANIHEITKGKLYALFNNAGYGQPGAVEDLTRTTLRKQFETNLFGVVELTNALLPNMLRQGCGRIIQNSSVLGFAAMPFRGAYNASKFALEGITDTLRLELANTGIHVSLIEPGPILSTFRKNALVALQNNIDFKKSRFSSQYEQVVSRLDKPGPAAPFTLGPEAVYKKVVHALESNKPQPRYYVTLPTYLMGFLKRILNTSLMDKVLERAGR